MGRPRSNSSAGADGGRVQRAAMGVFPLARGQFLARLRRAPDLLDGPALDAPHSVRLPHGRRRWALHVVDLRARPAARREEAERRAHANIECGECVGGEDTAV